MTAAVIHRDFKPIGMARPQNALGENFSIGDIVDACQSTLQRVVDYDDDFSYIRPLNEDVHGCALPIPHCAIYPASYLMNGS